jgi:hypothetical protein
VSDLPAIISAIGLMIASVFGAYAALDRRRGKLDGEMVAELESYQRWRPRVRRAVAALRDLLSEAGGTEPADLDELLSFPPPDPKAKHAREASADDAG